MASPLVRLELRREPSQAMLYATPFFAFALTLLAGLFLFEKSER